MGNLSIWTSFDASGTVSRITDSGLLMGQAIEPLFAVPLSLCSSRFVQD
jgi:hypothetical protein